MNYYGNKHCKDDPIIEVIRVGTLCHTQVIGGASKILKYFTENYPTIPVYRNKQRLEFPVKKVVYYIDFCHNSGISMKSSGYTFQRNCPTGLHNIALTDINLPELKVKAR